MMEIERIQAMAARAQSDAEKNEIQAAVGALGMTFQQMLGGTQRFMQTGFQVPVDFAAAGQAIETLRRIGEAYGEAFPECKDEAAVAEYVIRFGSEIMNAE